MTQKNREMTASIELKLWRNHPLYCAIAKRNKQETVAQRAFFVGEILASVAPALAEEGSMGGMRG